ncbi:two-component sensor histidine kinase [Gordonia spumicola]|uniref:histidine kinase n=1 Tax=Gordonia spumicola TaxID=589161 RepID=A0A7I9VEL2_9ACTN|nr:histidine kinase [Gordonia spumicola]GEE03735.1 two-component sensor histidine kinase [Gordonia spumicola]
MDIVERWVQLSYRRPMATASMVAALVAVCGAVAMRFEQRGGRPGDATLVAALIVVASAAFLVVKRTHPALAVIGTAAGAAGYIVYSEVFNAAAVLPLSVCLCTVASQFRARIAVAVTAAACGALTVVALVVGPDWLPVERIGLIGWPILGASIGGVTRARNRYVTAMETRVRVSTALYEYEAQQRVMEERLRISRDIHDVVAHHLSALNLQIGTALHLLDRPELAAAALEGMHENSEGALREIKGMVGMLRTDVDPGAVTGPGLDDVDALIGSVAESGLDVSILVRGTPRTVGADVGLAAYRMVQEALTNALKYAPGESALVVMEYRRSTLRIEVSNRLASTPSTEPGGFGLPGMAERLGAAGGRLEFGDDGDVFTVRAELPLDIDGDRP